MTTRRPVLDFVTGPVNGETHAGLWHDRYMQNFDKNDDGSKATDELLSQMERLLPSPYYTVSY
ncbi:MAG: hypothetical protein ACK46D_04890, partial [Roseiflexaceae bacterium]